MAESGRTSAPRTCRYGHSRPPLSAACRTFDSFGQARLANLFDSAAPASARAALHLAHSSKRPRSDPDHAAARHARRRQGFRAASRRLDRRAPRPLAEGRAVSCRAPWCRCAACRTGSCIAPASAARCGPKRATAARRFSASPAAPSISSGGCTIISSARRASDLQKAAQAYAEALGVRVKRLSIRDQSSRWGSCTSAGSLSFSWRLILAPPFVLDYLAAHEVAHLVEMNHSARFWRVVARVCPSVERAKTWLDTHGNDLHRYGIRISDLTSAHSRSTSQPSSPDNRPPISGARSAQPAGRGSAAEHRRRRRRAGGGAAGAATRARADGAVICEATCADSRTGRRLRRSARRRPARPDAPPS